jgi:diaminopimelate epimerase
MGDNPYMIWNFTKMHGAGNDFVVLDGVRQPIEMTAARARALAHRQFGIGCDQILLVEHPSHPEAHFRYRIFNADGSEVEHCGNGARCFVQFVHEQKLSSRNPLRAEISTGLITLEAMPNGEVVVDMGQTRFVPEALPFDVTGLATRVEGQDTLYALPLQTHTSLGEVTVWLSAVAISNPHAVQIVEDVDTAPVSLIGPLIESHPRFARRVNAGFLQIVDRHTAHLRVYERGAGETLACGSGACAAIAAGIRRGVLDSPVRVRTRGGWLTIATHGDQMRMTGPATTVFSSSIDIDRLVASIPPSLSHTT